MTLDYKFLHEYVQHEIKRLGTAIVKTRAQIDQYSAQRDQMTIAVTHATERKWEYGNGISRLSEKILEADVKLSYMEPKRAKLIEQEAILANLTKI